MAAAPEFQLVTLPRRLRVQIASLDCSTIVASSLFFDSLSPSEAMRRSVLFAMLLNASAASCTSGAPSASMRTAWSPRLKRFAPSASMRSVPRLPRKISQMNCSMRNSVTATICSCLTNCCQRRLCALTGLMVAVSVPYPTPPAVTSMLCSSCSMAATRANQAGASSLSGVSCATMRLPSLSIQVKRSTSPRLTWFLRSCSIAAYSPTSAWSATSGAIKASVSFCSRPSRAECSAAPSATSSAVCTPPAAMIAMPTASMRRGISPQFFQNWTMRTLFMAVRLGSAGLLDLRCAVELAVVVVVAVVRGDEAEVAIALQEVRAGLEDFLPLGVACHANQGGLDRGHLVGRHLRVRHDAQVLVDLRSPQRPVFERLAAGGARHDGAFYPGSRHFVDPELRRRGLLVAGEHDVDVDLRPQKRVEGQPVAGEAVARHEGDLPAVQVLQRLDGRVDRNHDLRADARAGRTGDDFVAKAIALRSEEMVGVQERVRARLGVRIAFLGGLRQLELQRHAALAADVGENRVPVLRGERHRALVQDVEAERLLGGGRRRVPGARRSDQHG